MTEIATMSAAVDVVLARSGRADKRADIIAYIRQTLQECQVPRFRRDIVEDQLVTTADPHIWTMPATVREMLPWQQLADVYDCHGNPVYMPYVDIGKRQNRFDIYWYQSGDSIVFAGHGAGTTINLAYLARFPLLAYYATADRPATYSLETATWAYLTATTTEDQQTARDLVTNWMLFYYFDTIVEGALAKLYKIVGDQRAVSTFALYKSMQNDLLRLEPVYQPTMTYGS